MSYPDLVLPLLERRDLTPEQAAAVMQFLMGGEATEAQIGGILLGLRIKGCTTRELAAFAEVMREKAATISTPFTNLVDTCGTGGGNPTFNISTAAAIVAAAAGARIAKHGNRSMTGQGSADVLEVLGVKSVGDRDRLTKMLSEVGLVFLFAPAHHPAMKHVASARKDLGLRTVFNQLGPLANPAGAKRQLIGVYDPGLMRSMGEALRLLGTERALLVHGLEGLDEISPCGPTEVVRVWDDRVSTEQLTPADFEMDPIDPQFLRPGATLQDSAVILREALGNINSPRAHAILPSAAAAIVLSGVEDSWPVAADRVRQVISGGLATAKLAEIIRCSEAE